MWALFTAALVFILLPLEITVETTLLKKGEFLDWLKKFRQSKGVSLFGILMAGASDKSAGEIINDSRYREDIAEFSAKDCWFLYFSEPEEESEHKTLHQQHAAGVHEVARFLGLEIKEMPCFVFFERPEYEHYIYVPLKGRSKDEIMDEIRRMFSHVRQEKDRVGYSTYRAIENYQTSQKRSMFKRKLIDFFLDTGMEFATRLVAQSTQPSP